MTDQQQAAPDFPDAWRPEPGDTITGRVVSVTLSPDFGYGPYPIVTLNVDGTERAVHAFHHVLRTELARRKPRAGDDLEITYQGKRAPKSGNGNDFHVYRVRGGQEPEFNWDSELPEDERGQTQQRSAPPIPSTPPPATVSQPPAEPAGAQFGEEPPF